MFVLSIFIVVKGCILERFRTVVWIVRNCVNGIHYVRLVLSIQF